MARIGNLCKNVNRLLRIPDPLYARRESRISNYIQAMHLEKIVPILLLAGALKAVAVDDYQPGPDSKAQDGVPQGEVTKHVFDQSKIFPGTTRDYWIYVPKQIDPSKPAPMLILQDGIRFEAPH